MGRCRRPTEYSYLQIIMSQRCALQHAARPARGMGRGLSRYPLQHELGARLGIALEVIGQGLAVFAQGHGPDIGLRTGDQVGEELVRTNCALVVYQPGPDVDVIDVS